MAHKSFFLFLFLTTFITHSYSMKDTTKISRAQQKYYGKKREWEYLENILINRVKEVGSKTKTNLKRVVTGAFIVPIVLLNGVLITTGTTDLTTLTGIGRILFSDAAFSIISGIGSLIINSILYSIYGKKIKNEQLINTLEMFLNKYNPEISIEDNAEINYKKVIPEELHETFDLLHEEYIQLGRPYLEENSLDIINSIKDTIMYKIKPKKYETKRQNKLNTQNELNANINAAMVSSAIMTSKK